MEVARRLWRGRVRPAWRSFLAASGNALEECAFRLSLAWAVLAGRVPMERERRRWDRSAEGPVLVDVVDWTDERLIFSVLVWPSLESPTGRAFYDRDVRVREVKEALGRACADRAWCTRFDTDYGLRWDARREVWAAGEGAAYDGARFGGRRRAA